jgi:HEAT repeat protein
MKNLEPYLMGGDLRSTAGVAQLVPMIKNQSDFDLLFQYLSAENRLLAMRAADALEKITLDHPEYLTPHSVHLIHLLDHARHKELKWHLAQLISRAPLTHDQLHHTWLILTKWAMDTSESKIVRVNALQALVDLSKQNIRFEKTLEPIIKALEKEAVPSIDSRLRKIKESRGDH